MEMGFIIADSHYICDSLWKGGFRGVLLTSSASVVKLAQLLGGDF